MPHLQVHMAAYIMILLKPKTNDTLIYLELPQH